MKLTENPAAQPSARYVSWPHKRSTPAQTAQTTASEHADSEALVQTSTVPPVAEWARKPGRISIVVPVYKEEEGIVHFGNAVIKVLQALGIPFELIFVEDDSPDRSFEKICDLYMANPEVVRAISMSRRFGHQASLAAGYQAARGDVVICMDGDMQHPPEMLPFLIYQWSLGYQLVYTRRRRQQGRSWIKEMGSRLFYRTINRLSELQLEDGTADFRLLDRVVVDALTRFSERGLFYRGLVQWAGFRRIAVEYEAPERFAGASSYTWSRMLRMGFDAIFSFSLFPLRFSYYVGGIILLGTLAHACYIFIAWSLGRVEVHGYTSLILLLTLLSSLHMLFLGIIGEYVGRVHEQVKGRPLFLVKQWIGFESESGSAPGCP
jgi:dolichol-phosphate mannosyltransferase